MVFEKMLTMQGMMFFFVIIGFIVRKRRIVGTTGRLNMVDLCLYVSGRWRACFADGSA